MFRRHRIDPDPTMAATMRDRLAALSVTSRTELSALDRQMVRGRLAASASTAHGLRVRLRQPLASSPRG